MAVAPTPTPPPSAALPRLRVFAKVAHASPARAPSRQVAAVVRFYVRGVRPRWRPLHPCPTSSSGDEVSPARTATVQRTFQFRELRAFLEAGRARAVVAGMLSLLPLDAGAECFQAWAGFISSVLVVAAARSRRRNLGGIIGIVRIDCIGAAEEDGTEPTSDAGEVNRDVLEAPLGGPEAATACVGDGGGGGVLEGWSCPICYEGLGQRGDQVARTPCGHGFHRGCIAKWLQSRRTCPVCRFEMPCNKKAALKKQSAHRRPHLLGVTR